MSLWLPRLPSPSLSPATSDGSNARNEVHSRPNINILEGDKVRIKKMFDKIELSASSYDTAWVAMIPSPSSPQTPLFPQSLNWLLQNQQNDGSWGLSDRHELLVKDSLLSTLACVLALKQWGVGEQQTNRGLGYIESNIASALDDKQHSPIGFDIIFSHLLEQAQKLDLNLPLGGKRLETFMQKRELELQSGWGSKSEGWKAYVAYISEGFGKSQNWEMAMKFQRKNGSLFNSPATTASAYTHINNAHCLDYLFSLLDKFGNAVPAVHPFDVYARLHMVDSLEKLGIDRHFKEEIESILEETWRMWQKEEDDIFLEPTTCAMAFRLLRLHGYNVSSDALDRFSEDRFYNSLLGYLRDVEAVLELHKASHIVLHSNDLVLEDLNSWTQHFLEEYLSSSSKNAYKLPSNHIDHEVPFAMRFPHHAYLDFILNRRSIEHYDVHQTRILKSSYCSMNLANKEFLKLGTDDFNHSQLLFREEFNLFNKWFMESGLEKLHFPISKTKAAYSFLTVAATLTSPELREARLTWAKQSLLGCVVDDFFDVWGTEDEHINLIQLMEKWDVDVDKESCSETVKIIFLALKKTIHEIAAEAYKVQGRSVLNHLIQITVDLLRSELKEAEWCRNKCVPSIEEYERNGIISMALGPIIIPVMYLVGPKLPQSVTESDEYNCLFELVSIYGRYLNDVNGYQREKEEGKFINSISLRLIHGHGEEREEEIIKKIQSKIEEKRKELLRMVSKEEGSKMTREVRDVYWKMSRSLHLIYKKEDVIHAKEMPNEVLNIRDIVLNSPIILDS
ncbi:ent-kaur-16-ene synthase, chloroplastic-like isoform X2 [Neltuma alba]|uniref:ent-kaur-16-ene synthase, chloroplastic-like isoform X2 n=1 Tax=Neltuma alba TaxID=207710 RepID=UPI0010A597DC|nr:ent-kaur-16-ene synthase, chloroplastic-like isoform X2 [Prosopis alba]